MEIVKVGEQKPITFKSGSTKMLRLTLFIVMAAVNNTPSNGDLDCSKIMLQIRKMTDGKPEKKIFGYSQLRVLHYTSNFYNWQYKTCEQVSQWVTLVAPDNVTKGQYLVNLNVPLTGPINCQPNEKLILDVNFQLGAFGAAIDPGLSYARAGFASCLEGYEYYTPTYDIFLLDATKTEFSESLGDGIMRVFYVNFDQPFSSAARTLMTSNFQSDRLNHNLIADDLKADMEINFPNYHDNTYQSVEIFNGRGSHVDKCQIDLSFNVANLTPGNNWIVVERAVTDGRMLQIAHAKQTLHGAMATSKAGVAGLSPIITKAQNALSSLITPA
jgi:hypothetical protein